MRSINRNVEWRRGNIFDCIKIEIISIGDELC